MKTFRTIIVTFTVTIIIVVVGMVGFLFNDGNITIEKRDVNHTKTVMIDGVVTEERNWSEVLGYDVKVAIFDGAYIGR